MRIRAIRTFDDLECGLTRSPGDVWEAGEARLSEINSAGWGDLAEAVEPAPGGPDGAEGPAIAKPARKRRGK